MIPFKVAAPKITPSMQNEMRSQKRSTLKRGRKKGKKGNKGKKTGTKALAKKHSKRDILKAASPKKKENEGDGTQTKRSKRNAKKTDADADKPKVEKACKTDGKTAQPKAKAKAKAKASASKKRASTPQELDDKHVYKFQRRVGEGKAWHYEVREDQKYGCRSCRFIYNGCQTCQRPGFKGRSAADVRAEMAAAKEVQDSSTAAASTETVSRKRKVRARDVN